MKVVFEDPQFIKIHVEYSRTQGVTIIFHVMVIHICKTLAGYVHNATNALTITLPFLYIISTLAEKQHTQIYNITIQKNVIYLFHFGHGCYLYFIGNRKLFLEFKKKLNNMATDDNYLHRLDKSYIFT